MENLERLQKIDLHVLEVANLSRNVQWDAYFIAITSSAAPIAYGVPIILLVVAYARRNVLLAAKALFIIGGVFASAVATETFKFFVNRSRPFETHPLLQKLSEGGSPSFPSGHTSDAFALSACLFLMWPKWYVALVCYSWALLVAYSRVDLGVHYPSDVIAGAFVGTASALGVFFYFRNKIKEMIFTLGHEKSRFRNSKKKDKHHS